MSPSELTSEEIEHFQNRLNHHMSPATDISFLENKYPQRNAPRWGLANFALVLAVIIYALLKRGVGEGQSLGAFGYLSGAAFFSLAGECLYRNRTVTPRYRSRARYPLNFWIEVVVYAAIGIILIFDA